jgi:hypothetical protein
MSLRTRLQRLERNTVDAGCPACRDRQDRVVFVTAQRLLDGTVVAEEAELQPCAGCEQIPELIIEVVETIVESRTEWAEGDMSP